ncbi:hypothetical protein [Chitinophaga sp. CF418]|uniref:hypothetical protein n=1 Tax=Chitinophaga sp. CF418 TaxID=1855287 RepID=UPI000923D829|nr:hypothetical protein [Chitinophaga sp. CF418]SHN45583.1 hypothetical protein SAMN05216311_120119 [Chitinophaga sp. CF418]
MWNENLSKEKRKLVLNACQGLTTQYLIAAFSEYCVTNGMEPTVTALDVVSRDRLIDLVYKMIFVTRVHDQEETNFWIDKNGRYFVELNKQTNG